MTLSKCGSRARCLKINPQKQALLFNNFNITGLRPPVYNVEKRTSVLFVSVSFMILMLISLAWLVFYYVQRFRYIHAKDQRERKLTSQAKRALAIISTSVLKSEDLHRKDFNDTCAVCIENCELAKLLHETKSSHVGWTGSFRRVGGLMSVSVCKNPCFLFFWKLVQLESK